MNDQILTAYRELDAEARNYADPDRAVAAARRRRRTRFVAAAVAAPLVAGTLGVGAALWPAAESAPPPVVGAERTISVTEPGVIQPPAKPQPLPTGAVGNAALVYTPCFSGCDALVALTDGRQFVVPPDPDGVFAGSLTLSPDGAWIGYPVAGEYLVRDLTGKRVHRLEGSSPGRRIGAAAWSADSGRLLVFDEPRAGGDGVYTMLDVGTGAVTTPGVPTGSRVVGVLPDGAVLYRPSTQTGRAVTLSTSDGRTFPIDLGNRLTTGESVQAVHLARDGREVYVVVGTPHPDVPTAGGAPTAVVSVALTGKTLARYELGTTSGAADFWEPLGVGVDGFVFGHCVQSGETTRTTLVTVSAAGSRQGLVVPGSATSDAGVPVVRIPG
ncbi:TolB family protein [Plantactinospora solaniradicis]|uniref:TolB family protein n=1 Tax=Plantactinospora solaniradicis TaxID=1723736 RepID=A0ABW1KB25_9ACTN